MGLFHYSKTSSLIEHILPKMLLQSNYLSEMNDPREKWLFLLVEWMFLIRKSLKVIIMRLHILIVCINGKNIKDRIQVICFSGAKDEGWNNEMMWAHYGDRHKGVCIEFEEEILLKNLIGLSKDFRLDNISYSEEADRFLYWNYRLNIEDNITHYIHSSYKDLAFKKSSCWNNEDERRLILINEPKQVFVHIEDAIKSIYVGTDFPEGYIPSIKKLINSNINLYRLVYQRYRFEQWDID